MTLRVLSLGWGVQSFTLAAMMAEGEIEPVDVAIHADTTHEASGTYEHAAKWAPWLEERGIKVLTVVGRETTVVQANNAKAVLIPAFTESLTGTDGQVRRQCTNRWKIAPIRREIRRMLEQRGEKATVGAVEMVTGISYDEFMRMRDSDVAYVRNVYPLVDRRITRADCITWLDAHGLDVPPKSACVFCPYHSIRGWVDLARRGGDDWQKAVDVDETIRNKRPGFELYVHPSRKPLPVAIGERANQLELDFVEEQPCDSGVCWT